MYVDFIPFYDCLLFFFFFQAEDGIRDLTVTGVQTCALPISARVDHSHAARRERRAPDPGSRRRRPQFGRARYAWRGAGALRPPDPPTARHYSRDRSHRLWEDHHAVRRARPPESTRGEDRDRRGPRRIPDRRCVADPPPSQDRTDVRRRAPLHSAP